jgi:hypothetical protein
MSRTAAAETRDGWQPSGSGSAHRSAYENEGEDVSDLTEKVALVSGAARSIGAAIAQTVVDHAEQQVLRRQALAVSSPGGEVVG